MSFTPEMRTKAADTRKKKAELRREQGKTASGIGESKRFGAPEGTFPESSVLNCHVGGVLIRDLPVEVQCKILYQQTDEGIAERNEGKVESAARVTRDEFTGACDRRRDAIESGMEPWEAPNPLKEVADAHVGPGMSPKFLSPNRLDKEGTRGYEIVHDPKTGEPVKVRNMVLAQMPKTKVEQRNKFYRAKANQAIQEIQRQHREEGGEMAVGEVVTK